MLKWCRIEQGDPKISQDTRQTNSKSEKLPVTEMCGEWTDSGREATDSASLTSSHQSNTSSGACSSCTDTSGAPRGETSAQVALKIPNARRDGITQRHFRDAPGALDRGMQGHSRGWGSVEHLESDEDTRHAQPIRETSSVDNLLDAAERPIRGILRRHLPERSRYASSRPRFVFSRYNPQFRTLPAAWRGQERPCLPPPGLPLQKSFLSLQKFRRRPERDGGKERWYARQPKTADLAELRYDLAEESRSIGYLSATEVEDVRYFSRLEIRDAQCRSGTEAEQRTDPSRPDHAASDPHAHSQRRPVTAPLSIDLRHQTPSAADQGTSPEAPTAASESQHSTLEEEQLMNRLVSELVNTPPTLRRWYQALSASRSLGLLLPLYRGLLERLDPVSLATLLLKGRHELRRATEDHSSADPALLSFRRGDVLRVIRGDRRSRHGWWFGVLRGRHGVFPSSYVTALGRGEHCAHHPPTASLEHGEPDDSDSWVAESTDEEHQGDESDGESPDSSNSDRGSAPEVEDGKHSLLQYAMTHFRAAEERYNLTRDDDGPHTKMQENKNKKNKKKGKEDWTWREQVELVKWTDQPLRVSLLKLSSPEMGRLAVESFLAIQRYMGDQPLPPEVTDVDCVYTVLMACHRFEALRDEVYCQLMRQTTSNRSPQPDSCRRGWRLLALVAAFFPCSDTLRPCLTGLLETTARDRRRDHHRAASACLQNLRRTLRLGGRRNVPSEREVAAVTTGRPVCRQRYLLPGGTRRLVRTRSATVVQDVVAELCAEMGVTSEEEQGEFSLFCVVDGDAFTLPLARHEYIIDVTTELRKNGQVFHLVLVRSVWFFPPRLDQTLYVESAFCQVAPDYLEGLLLVMPAETLPQTVLFDIARVAALLHRAAGLRTMPTMKETKYLLPKAALLVRDVKPPQWVNMVQDSWAEVQDRTPAEARRAVLETLSSWPLFGSAFFLVSSGPEDRPDAATDRLLAVNSRGLHLLDTVTHETRSNYPISEVLSTRRVKSDSGQLFLDVRVGTPKQASIIRLRTENAPEIARLIRQYSSLEQRHRPLTADSRERQVSR